MSQFSNLISLYEHLERCDLNVRYLKIENFFKQVRDELLKQGNLEEIQKAQVEIDVFNFQVYKGEIKPLITGSDKGGKDIEYPSLKRFNKADYDYLLSRFESTQCPLLKARYGHVLWKGIGNLDAAKQAVEAYLTLSEGYDKLNKSFPEKTWGNEFLHMLENFFVLSLTLSYKPERAKHKILEILEKYPANLPSSFLIHLELAKHLLKTPKLFGIEDFNGLQEKLWSVASQSQNPNQFIELCLIAEKVGKKVNHQQRNWQEEIGRKFEEMMLEQKGKDVFSARLYCEDAIQAYKNAKNHEKATALEAIWAELKKSLELTTLEHTVDITDYKNWCEKTAEEISNLDAHRIISILMWDKNLLPDVKRIREEAKRQVSHSIFAQLLFPAILDQNRNVAQYFHTEEEKQKFFELNLYKTEIELKGVLIDAIISKAIEKNKLTFEAMIEFLKSRFWIGQAIPKSQGSEMIEHVWLNLVAPALKSFFEEARKPNNDSRYIQVVDSLVPKIEGMLRDICWTIQIPISKIEYRTQGRPISREKYMYELIYEDKLKGFVEENDLFFLKFLFVDQGGYNVRNKVAHGLIFEKDYSKTLALVVLVAFLRLSKYQFSDSPIQYEDDIFTETIGSSS